MATWERLAAPRQEASSSGAPLSEFPTCLLYPKFGMARVYIPSRYGTRVFEGRGKGTTSLTRVAAGVLTIMGFCATCVVLRHASCIMCQCVALVALQLATSVGVEQTFSKGLLLSHIRNRLSLAVQSTRALVCLGLWSLQPDEECRSRTCPLHFYSKLKVTCNHSGCGLEGSRPTDAREIVVQPEDVHDWQ